MGNIDLHMHTKYSDGSATIHEAIHTAKERDLSCIAITDHFTTTWKRAVIKTLKHKHFDSYRDEIISEREAAKFNCLIGIEIDMGSKWKTLITLPFEKFEILLFEYVDSIVILKDLARLIQEFDIQGIKALAHNKYFQRSNLELFAKILVENNIYFEINSSYTSYINKGGLDKLKYLRDAGVKFTVGSDAHNKDRIGHVNRSLALLEKIDGLDRLITIDELT
jgi:histidinol phosphatase-like PHP family hydrolase